MRSERFTVVGAINTLHLLSWHVTSSLVAFRGVYCFCYPAGERASDPNHSSPNHEVSVAAMAGHGDLQEMLRMLTARKASMMAAMGYIKALQSKNLKRRDTDGVNSCLLGEPL
jgi:hypothetical protein